MHVAERHGRRLPAFPGASRCAAGTPPSCRTRWRASCAPSVACAQRRLQQLRRQLDACDLGPAAGGHPDAAGRRPTAAWTARSRGGGIAPIARLRDCAGRLETLSPLAVLGRGYAVCWNADRNQRHPRRGDDVAPGDRVRVTLAKGELDCDVRDRPDGLDT